MSVDTCTKINLLVQMFNIYLIETIRICYKIRELKKKKQYYLLLNRFRNSHKFSLDKI